METGNASWAYTQTDLGSKLDQSLEIGLSSPAWALWRKGLPSLLLIPVVARISNPIIHQVFFFLPRLSPAAPSEQPRAEAVLVWGPVQKSGACGPCP